MPLVSLEYEAYNNNKNVCFKFPLTENKEINMPPKTIQQQKLCVPLAVY